MGTFTTTLTVHVPLAGMEPPANVADPAPAVAVKVPPHVLVVVDGAATTMAAGVVGKVSENATAVMATAVPLVKVNVSVLGCPSCTGLGLKTLSILGRPTDKISLEAAPFPALPVVTVPVLLL